MARRARKDLDVIQEKRARVVELRARGLTWEAIAAAVGYSNPSAASKAWRAAIRQRPDMAVDQVREEAKSRLEYVLRATAEQIENCGPRVSAIGKVAIWPPGSPKAGQIVEDESIRARALDNYRKTVTDYAKLCGAFPDPQPAHGEIERQYAAAMEAARAKRAAELAELDGYRALAAATPQPGDRTWVDAEIVDP